MNDAILAVIKVAASQVGVRESNNNSGATVQKYQAATTLGGTHWPWCAAFIAWCVLQALGAELARIVWIMSASCDQILDWARRRDIVFHTPEVGDAGLVMASANDATHIFLVTKVTARGFYTIEGNTNKDGSRNGDGVYERFRPHSKRYLFVRWGKDIPATSTEAPQTYTLYLGDAKAGDFPVVEGRTMIPAWKWAKWMRSELGWNVEAQTVMFDGREVLKQPMMVDGRAWLPIRVLAAFSGLSVTVDDEKRTVTVTR
jgi:hypothetical protein